MEHTNEPPENRATGYAANGNVSEYVSPSGAILSHYDYSPFGELLIATSSHPAPFRFSTKYHDPETDTLYYGYRHYSPRLGRWLSRDPLEENGARSQLSSATVRRLRSMSAS
ncbi:MAG: RHS repeat-associated core domain-containing protein [Kiritimatiellae bacterium]|nr:RHS repeat-associated core domain-containing protein [Kiritimatiellia bacterium]